MAKLVYSAIMSLDGYTTDDDGNIEWSAPDPDVLTLINDLERGSGIYLWGRRMYETMVYWETFDAAEDQPPELRDFAAIWRAADKLVFSRTLGAVSSARTRIEREFDWGAVLRMKETAGHDLSVGGPDLASQAMAAGLVDEMHLFVTPVTVGGGTPALPDRFRSNLDCWAWTPSWAESSTSSTAPAAEDTPLTGELTHVTSATRQHFDPAAVGGATSTG